MVGVAVLARVLLIGRHGMLFPLSLSQTSNIVLSRLLRLHPRCNTPLAPPLPLILPLHGLTLPTHRSPPPTTRRTHHNPLPLPHSSRILPPQINPPILTLVPIIPPTPFPHMPHPIINPTRRLLSPFKPIRMIHPPLAKDRHLNRNPKLNIPHHALSTFMLPLTATPLSQCKLPQDDRIPPLKHFCICNPRIRHMRMHATRPVPIRPRPRPSSYRLIVPKPLCRTLIAIRRQIPAEAEGQIVAVALGGGAGGEGEEDHVCDALRGEYVAAYDGGFVGG